MIITKKQFQDFYVKNGEVQPMSYEDYLWMNHQKLQASTEPSAEALIEEIEEALKVIKAEEDVQR